MAVALLEPHTEDASLLHVMRSDLRAFAQQLESTYLTLSPQEAAATLVEVEQLSKLVDHLQTVAARAAEDHQLATTDARDPYRNTADYLRAKIGVSRSEANRRLRLGQDVLPDIPGPGAAVEPALGFLAEATRAGAVSSRAATIIRDAVHRVSTVATRQELDAMEDHLVRQAIESDEDVLRALARRWEDIIDQDGQEPTEKTLRARQGVFLRGRRHGLHFMEIGATDEQFEHLITVMNTATNPRAQGTTPVLERPTREQNLLDGLVAACRIALAGDGLPATGGHRPQVMVTINYRDLLGDMADMADSTTATQSSPNNSAPGASANSHATPTSSHSCSAAKARSSTSAAPNASSHRICDGHWSHATKAAPSPTAPRPQPGAKPTTSSPGQQAEPPPSTTAYYSAPGITTRSTKETGQSNQSTESPGSDHPNTSTPSEHPNATATGK